MNRLAERLGVELPVVQAGMGGGLAGHELAAAVSDAGGLGTLGIMAPEGLAAELRAARERTERPIAVNLLLPFTRRGHAEVAARADVVVTFWGRPRRLTDVPWLHQCGSVEEASAAVAAGADGVIAQGVEAGGHVRGTTPRDELVARVRAAVGADVPVWAAGGIADAADVRDVLAAGADAAVLGTRFVLTPECRAHAAYRARLLEAEQTVLTELFGAGWPAAPHRVVPNAATRRWLRRGDRGPAALRALHRVSAPALARLPAGASVALARAQRPGAPLLSPQPPVAGSPAAFVDAAALYAGTGVARMHDVRPAAEVVRSLALGCRP